MHTILLIIFAFVGIQVDNSKSQAVPAQTTTLCALVDHPDQYTGRNVQVKANILSGMEFSVLHDDSCPPKENLASGKHDVVLATFNQDYDVRSPIARKLKKLLKKKQQAEVVVLGTFTDPGKYVGHQLCCRYSFDIKKLLSVTEVDR